MNIPNLGICSTMPEMNIAMEATLEAGKAVMNVYNTNFNYERKADNSLMTDADLTSNQIIKNFLSKTQIPILSEEDDDDKKRLESKRVWIVDPLDGTSDFVNRTGEFTIMVALVEKFKPVFGIIYWPLKDILYVARDGYGAYQLINGIWNKVKVSKINNLTESRVIVSRFHHSEIETRVLNKISFASQSFAGSSLKVLKICSGDAEVYFATNNKMKQWDTCAAYCLVKEAGGRMTDLDGNDIEYNTKTVNHENGILVTNGNIHDQIINIIKKIR